MIKGDYIYGTISKDIVPDLEEVQARLRVGEDFSMDLVEKCRQDLLNVLDIKYCGVRIGVSYPGEDLTDLGFGQIKSNLMYRKLKNSKEAFVFAVTLGIGVDRLLNKLSVTSVYGHYVTDALASAYAEKACDIAQDLIKKDIPCHNRFSVGYGDISLTVQPEIVNMTNAGKLLNITVGKNLLMTPAKTITAIMGIK